MRHNGDITPTDVISELKVSAHLMTLETGLFCVFQVEDPHTPPHALAHGLPGVRVTLAPNAPMQGSNVEISCFRPDGWIGPRDDAALIRITEGPAQVLVTVYQLPHTSEPPKLQVLRLNNAAARHGAPALPQPAQGGQWGGAPGPQPVTGPAAEIGAHVHLRGDITARLGEWIGDRGTGRWIEGFSIAPAGLIALEDIEYQALLGRGWLSPWATGGQFCGSRGMSLPLLGVRVRLRGQASEHYDCFYSATFVDGTAIGPVSNGQPCESASLAPLETFQVLLRPRYVAPPSPQTGYTTQAPGAAPRAVAPRTVAKPVQIKPVAAKPVKPGRPRKS